MFIMENDGTITLPRDIGSTLSPVQALTFDPRIGSGANLDEMDAPADFDSATILFDPYVTA